MSMVRFATVCDRCPARSPEYSAWPTCRECGDHVCDGCAEPGTLREADLDSPATALCPTCAAVLEAA